MVDLEYYQDKICIVTGGNSGIGYALCEELLKRGAVVYMAGRNPEKVKKICRTTLRLWKPNQNTDHGCDR